MALAEYNTTTTFLKDYARDTLQVAENQAARIRANARPDLKKTEFVFTPTDPGFEPPPSFSDLFAVGDGTAEETVRLNALVNDWLADYFPAITGCLKTVPDEWLCDIISGTSPFGLSETYFDLVWHQARDRASRARRTEVANIDSGFSARGFSIPPGAMVAQLAEAEQRASESALEVNRAEAIKDAEIKLELLKFAEEQALRYKQGIMQSLANFYSQWLTMPDRDIERTRIRAQAMSSLYAALSSFYNVEIAFEQLKMRAKELDATVDGAIDARDISVFQADNSSDALAQAVRGFADISSAAANAAGSLVAQFG